MKRERGVGEMLIVYAIGAVAVLALFWWAVSAIESRGYARGMAECERAAKEQRDKEAAQAAGASTILETGNVKAKVVYRTITQQVDKYIDRPVYRSVCLDADGLRDANASLRGPSAPAGEPDKPVPGFDLAPGRDGGERAKETDRGGGAVLRMPAEAGGAR